MPVESVGISCVVRIKPCSHYYPHSVEPSDILTIFPDASTPVVLPLSCRIWEGGVNTHHHKPAYHSLLAWQGLILQDAEHQSITDWGS